MTWMTCCLALHNWLLEVDGLDEKWDVGVLSDWQGDAGVHDETDGVTTRALERLNNPS